ncbi:MAG: response regulator [Clostridiaceae bacterium]|nr:response regulator [Clostridiaceae bacterium]
MLKLMIVEDEELERMALRFLVNKYYKDSIQVVGECSNGRDAVDKAILYKPDIVLMDINMPIMDGLEAATIIKNNCKNTEIVILTAFNYFDYAKKAIEIGVSDYLLKPFFNEEFCSAVDKLMDKINTKITDENINKKLKNKYKKVIPYIEKEMITSIVYGVTLTNEQYDGYRDMLDIKHNRFCSIVFKSNNKKVFSENSIYNIKNKLGILFPEIIGCLCLNDIVLFVFEEDLESEILSRKFENLLKSLQDDLRSNNEINIYTGVSYVNEGLNKLYLSYKEAKLSSERKQNMDSIFKSEIENNIMDQIDINKMEVTICGRIINEDLDGAILELDNLINKLLDNSELKDFSAIKKSLIDVFNVIIENISEFTGKDFNDFNITKSLEELMTLEDILGIKHCTNMIIKNIINFISNYKRSKNIHVIEKARKYIESNYIKEITLDELSQHVSMSTYYFSRIFSKIEGMTFRDYLIKIRMEKAKNLLRQGDKSIKQVALEVGYIDQNYFSKAFKKYTNLSPKEYIKL